MRYIFAMAEENYVTSDAMSSAMTVHGMEVGEISPVRKSVNTGVPYFNSSFTDGRKTLHMVSFVHDKFEEAQSHSPIAMNSCIVKRGGTDELEIL